MKEEIYVIVFVFYFVIKLVYSRKKGFNLGINILKRDIIVNENS